MERQAKVLTAHEEQAIFENLTTDRDRLMFGLTLYTGGRISEVIQLTWGNINKVQVRYPREITKGKKSGRAIPINPKLAELIDNHRPEDAKPSDPIFMGRNHAPIKRLRAHRILEAAVAKAGLDGMGISTHSGRRTFLTRLNRLGLDYTNMAAMSGHASVDVLRRYLERDDDVQAAAVAQL